MDGSPFLISSQCHSVEVGMGVIKQKEDPESQARTEIRMVRPSPYCLWERSFPQLWVLRDKVWVLSRASVAKYTASQEGSHVNEGRSRMLGVGQAVYKSCQLLCFWGVCVPWCYQSPSADGRGWCSLGSGVAWIWPPCCREATALVLGSSLSSDPAWTPSSCADNSIYVPHFPSSLLCHMAGIADVQRKTFSDSSEETQLDLKTSWTRWMCFALICLFVLRESWPKNGVMW